MGFTFREWIHRFGKKKSCSYVKSTDKRQANSYVNNYLPLIWTMCTKFDKAVSKMCVSDFTDK